MKRNRNGELDVLRFVFSIVIVLLHFGTGVFPYGSIAVEFYFTLSGLLMARHAEKLSKMSSEGGIKDLSLVADETWGFIKGKFKSFYKYYLTALAFNVIVRNLIIKHISAKTFITALFKSIPTVTLSFFAISENSTSYYVHSTWFLSAMLIAMFVLYPILLRNYRFAVKIVFPVLTLFLLGYEQTTNQNIGVWDTWSGFTYFGILRAASEIAFGATLYYISTELTRNEALMQRAGRPLNRTLLTLAKVICYGVVLWYAHKTGFGIEFSRAFQLHALLFCGIGILLSYTGLGWTISDCKLTRYLGKISLPIYIFHKLLRATYLNYLGVEKISMRHTWFLIVVCMIGSVLLMYFTNFVSSGINKLRVKQKETVSVRPVK